VNKNVNSNIMLNGWKIAQIAPNTDCLYLIEDSLQTYTNRRSLYGYNLENSFI